MVDSLMKIRLLVELTKVEGENDAAAHIRPDRSIRSFSQLRKSSQACKGFFNLCRRGEIDFVAPGIDSAIEGKRFYNFDGRCACAEFSVNKNVIYGDSNNVIIHCHSP
jgi:hypothetical protein